MATAIDAVIQNSHERIEALETTVEELEEKLDNLDDDVNTVNIKADATADLLKHRANR